MWLYKGGRSTSARFLVGDRVRIRGLGVEGNVHSLHDGLVLVVEDGSGIRQLWRPDEIALIQPVDSGIARVDDEETARFESILFCAEFTRWAVIGILALLLMVVVAQLGHLRGWWM